MFRLAATLLLCAAFQDPSTTADALPLVRPVRGELLAWRKTDAKAVPVTKETRIAPADRLGTRDGDYAAFSTEAGSIVALKGVRTGAERGLGLERRENKLVFRVFEGKVAVQTFEEGLQIETPQGQIAANKSYFLVEVEKDRTKVVAVDGEVTFTTSLGTVVVESGRETVAEAGKKPSAPRIADVGRATEEFSRHEAPSNLVKNAGFEDGLKEWGPTHFYSAGKKQTDLETGLAHSGRACMRLDLHSRVQGEKIGQMRFAAQELTAVPGKKYLLRAYFRSDVREGQIVPRIGIGGLESPDSWLVPCDKNWKLKSMIVTARDRLLSVQIQVDMLTDKYDGSIWVDDILLSELPATAKPK